VDYHVSIINSTISNNESYSGGVVYAGSFFLKNSLVTNNRVSYYGGAVYSNNLNCENSVLSNNSSENGGAAALFSSNSTVLNHCRVTGNNNTQGVSNSYSVVYTRNALVVGSVFENNNGYLFGTGNYHTVLVNNTFINNKNDGVSYIKGRFINNLFDAGVDLYSDSTIYNNYIDYFTLKENNHVVVKKNNVQPSEGALSLTNKLVPNANSVLVNKGLNFANPTFKSLFAVGEKFNSSDDETMYDRIVKMLQKDYQGKNRIVGGTIDIGANEKQ
jgi:hypothetical protein